jgi:hypothetical protein
MLIYLCREGSRLNSRLRENTRWKLFLQSFDRPEEIVSGYSGGSSKLVVCSVTLAGTLRGEKLAGEA